MVDQPAGSSDAAYAPSDRAFGVDRTKHGDVAILTVTGDVDALTAPQLSDALAGVLDDGPAAVIVDMSEVAFLASAGMSVLVEANERMGSEAKLLVVADGPATSRPIKLVGIDKLVPLYATMDDALNSCVEA